MKETMLQSLSQQERDVVEGNNGLKMYLRGLSAGKEPTPRSNLYNLEGKTEILSPDEIKARWMEILTQLKESDSFGKNVFHFDSHQLEKWGPQGGVAPMDELLNDIVLPTFSGSSKSIPEAFNTENWKLAKRTVVKHLHNAGCKGLSPVPLNKVVDDMRSRDTLESNSGWPDFTRRKLPDVTARAIQDAQNGQWKTYPAIALFRNYNLKTRLVWMFPMSANLVEGSFFQILQQKLMATSYAPAKQFLTPWRGFEQVKSLVTDAYRNGCIVGASDFTSTDAHFQLTTSMEVLDVLKECFQPRYRNALSESITHMHTIPLVISDKEKIVGNHGVSSGSNWTNFIETIFDWILAEYVRIETSASLQLQGLYAIGDDMCWISRHDPGNDEIQRYLEAAGNSVGQVIKAEKTMFDPDKVKTLQRLFQPNYYIPNSDVLRGVYSTVRALKSLVYPEKFHKPQVWSKDMEAIRSFMILENCVDHPLFEAFCKFAAKGDPHLKEFANYTEQKQNALFRKSKLIPGLTSTYNQEKRDQSLSTFNSVKFIANLR